SAIRKVTCDNRHIFQGRKRGILLGRQIHPKRSVAAEAGRPEPPAPPYGPARAKPTYPTARLKWAFEPLSCRLLQGSEPKLAPMTVSSPNVIEIKLDRLIDDMRVLRSQLIAFDRHLNEIEASLKPSEPSEQQAESKSRPWFAAAAIATARTVLILFAVGAAT